METEYFSRQPSSFGECCPVLNSIYFVLFSKTALLTRERCHKSLKYLDLVGVLRAGRNEKYEWK